MRKIAILAALFIAGPALAQRAGTSLTGTINDQPSAPATHVSPPEATPFPPSNGVSSSGEVAIPRSDEPGNDPVTTKQHEMLGN